MHFDGGFTGTEFRRNLLIKHPGNDQVYHVALPIAYVGTRLVHRRAAASAIVRSSPVG